jgi:hypothetical protein
MEEEEEEEGEGILSGKRFPSALRTPLVAGDTTGRRHFFLFSILLEHGTVARWTYS